MSGPAPPLKVSVLEVIPVEARSPDSVTVEPSGSASITRFSTFETVVTSPPPKSSSSSLLTLTVPVSPVVEAATPSSRSIVSVSPSVSPPSPPSITSLPSPIA